MLRPGWLYQFQWVRDSCYHLINEFVGAENEGYIMAVNFSLDVFAIEVYRWR